MKSSWRSYGKICVLRFVARGFFIVEKKISVPLGDLVTFTGRLHCLADAEMYAGLSADDLDIDVEGCLVYGTTEDGSDGSYNTSAESLWQAYSENKE